MKLSPLTTTPRHSAYDVVIIGGAMIGSSVAWHLSNNSDFDGTILVIEKDPGYEWTSTARTNSCVRQQFSNAINVHISQYAVQCMKHFREYLGGDPEVPDITLQSFGYLYLAGSEAFADILRDNQKLQAACGAGTRILMPQEMATAFPFYNLDDIVLGSHNPIDEGYFDGNTMFDWWRRKARQNAVEYLSNEAVSIQRSAQRVTGVTLKSGERISAGTIVNACGPRAALTARMAGLDIPVEPRRRYTFIFAAEKPLGQDLPLTIDPSGVHVRSDGGYYLCGCPPDEDPAVDYDDFYLDESIWENKVWPALAHRIPAFEAIKLMNAWVGHYAFNTFDQNAIVGPHPQVGNFIFVNGFSGHGFQQSPAMGRGVAELICHGEYRSLDLSELGYQRLVRNAPFLERAII